MCCIGSLDHFVTDNQDYSKIRFDAVQPDPSGEIFFAKVCVPAPVRQTVNPAFLANCPPLVKPHEPSPPVTRWAPSNLYETHPNTDDVPVETVEVVRVIDGRRDLTFLSVDRSQDRAVFFGIGLFPPVRRVIAPLSLIAGVQVVNHERKEGKPEYGVTVRLHKGRHIKLGCRSRDQAMTIMRKIARYLGLAHRN